MCERHMLKDCEMSCLSIACCEREHTPRARVYYYLQPSGLYYYLESKEAPPDDADDIDRLAVRDNLKLAVVCIRTCIRVSVF